MDNNCVICFSEEISLFSIGSCNHAVCIECSTRMRVLCNQRECSLCRRELNMVVFVDTLRPYQQIIEEDVVLHDENYGICFENAAIKEVYDKLLQNTCQKCPGSLPFPTMNDLCSHMNIVHGLNSCKLCTSNIKMLPRERRFYTDIELTRHNEIGDADDQSFGKHPACKSCGVRIFDQEQMRLHTRRKHHLYCHICASFSHRHYYRSREELILHYRRTHFLCPEPECINQGIVSVFYTDRNLRAHRAIMHPGSGTGSRRRHAPAVRRRTSERRRRHSLLSISVFELP